MKEDRCEEPLDCMGCGVCATQERGKMTIAELLEYLDGRGLVITDDELIADALEDVNLDKDDQIITLDQD